MNVAVTESPRSGDCQVISEVAAKACQMVVPVIDIEVVNREQAIVHMWIPKALLVFSAIAIGVAALCYTHLEAWSRPRLFQMRNDLEGAGVLAENLQSAVQVRREKALALTALREDISHGQRFVSLLSGLSEVGLATPDWTIDSLKLAGNSDVRIDGQFVSGRRILDDLVEDLSIVCPSFVRNPDGMWYSPRDRRTGDIRQFERIQIEATVLEQPERTDS